MVQLHLRHLGPDDLERALGVHAEDLASAAGEVAHDGSHEILWHADLDLRDGLKQARLGRLERLAKGLFAGDLEGDILGINRVHFAVVKVDLDIHHAVAGEDAVCGGAVNALLDGGHEYSVDILANKGLGEFDAVVAGSRLDAHPHFGELAGASTLFLVAVLGLTVAADGFAERNLRGGEFHLDVETFLDALHGDLQVQLALAGDDGLVKLGVDVVLE